jgi:hypothetical protein
MTIVVHGKGRMEFICEHRRRRVVAPKRAMLADSDVRVQ